ncbi:13375_t:CDS:1, partial [Acaulospora colombiana]
SCSNIRNTVSIIEFRKYSPIIDIGAGGVPEMFLLAVDSVRSKAIDVEYDPTYRGNAWP